uniref:Putative muscle system process n=1 Tax=Nyssomyia neivai TaxID=330878 RepID=A0A1L8E5S5_9DIPT
MDDDGSQRVELYIYDLTQGMASMMSEMILGRHIEGVWHTGVVVFGREFFFGSQGIQSCPPGGTVLGAPHKVEKIGETFIPFQVFKDYVRGLAESTFRGSCYSLLKHNCNTFSNEITQFLCGVSIPKNILDLPQEFLGTPLGQTLGPLIDSIGTSENNQRFSFEPRITGTREASPGFDELNTEIEQARLQSLALNERRNNIKEKIAKKERKKEKKKRKSQGNSESDYSSNNGMSEVEANNGDLNGATTNGDGAIPSEMLPSEKVLEEEAREKAEEEERKRQRDPPVVFNNIDPKVELEALVKLLDGKLSKEDETSIEELHQYLLEGEGSWALSDGFLVFAERVLRDPGISTETRVHLLRCLGNAALKDDVILLLHQDRRDHVLMNYAQDIDRLSPEEQQAIALFMCNLFENSSSSEWLLYISEWTYNTMQTSNIRASTKVAVHCLLAACPTLQDLGTAIIHNLACKEVKTVVFDDVAVELAMAILQFFNNKPNEEHLFRTMKALARFVTVSPDVPQLVQMIGPNPSTFKGTSERIDQQIAQMAKKIR